MIAQSEMAAVVTATEAKNNLGQLLRRVAENGEEIVIERQGRPRAVIISVEDYARYKAAAEQQRRSEALAWLREFEVRQRERNKDLTDDQIEEIADQLTREAIDSLVEKGHIRFAS